VTQLFETRRLRRMDLPSLAAILGQTGLFPAELLDEMVAPFFAGDDRHHWLVACLDGEVMGFAFSEAERMTDQTHNLLAIAVLPSRQHAGCGQALVAALEMTLSKNGGRLLIVETSSLDEYEGTRRFYDRLKFTREAEIREFYAAGENKIVFRKAL
jgi:ribosomal protein S18 acetylase RimI-like enzyme